MTFCIVFLLFDELLALAFYLKKKKKKLSENLIIKINTFVFSYQRL
jgi:hypothetical protein